MWRLTFEGDPPLSSGECPEDEHTRGHAIHLASAEETQAIGAAQLLDSVHPLSEHPVSSETNSQECPRQEKNVSVHLSSLQDEWAQVSEKAAEGMPKQDRITIQVPIRSKET